MCESLTRLSFAECLACPKLDRGRPFEARPGLTPTRLFCRTRSHPVPDATSFHGDSRESRLGHFPEGCLACLQPSWAREAGLAIDYVRLGVFFAPNCQFRMKIPRCTGRKFPTPELH